MCSVKFDKKSILKNTEISNKMKKTMTKCECGDKILLSDVKSHKMSCPVYNKEITDMAAKLKKEKPKDYINRSTFNCPFCSVINLLQKDIVKHITQKHPHKAAVYFFIFIKKIRCPICVVQPYGDPNYVSPSIFHYIENIRFGKSYGSKAWI